MWLWGLSGGRGWGTRSRPWSLCPNMSMLFKQGAEMWPDDPWRRPETRDISPTQLSERYRYTDKERQQTGRDIWLESRVVSAWNSSSPEAEAERAPVLGQPGLCSEFQPSLSYIAIPCHKKEDRNVGLTISLKRLSNRQTWWPRYISETQALKFLWRGVYTCQSGSGFYVTNVWRVINSMYR